MFFLIALFVLSLSINIILIWYVRKMVQILSFGIENIDDLQGLLNEYASLLEPVASMENYFADPAITSAVANTKLVMEACRVYKKTLIHNYDEEETQETSEEEAQKEPRKAQAKISSVKA